MNSPYALRRRLRISLSTLLALLCLNLTVWTQTPNTVPSPTGQPKETATQQDPLAEAAALQERVFELNQQGKYDEALPLAERALRLREDNLDPNNLLIAGSLAALATLVQLKGDFDRAESLLQRALKIREKFLGPNDYQVSIALTAIANLQRVKGDYGQAVKTFSRSLAIREKLFGSEHPVVALTLNNLASVYQNMGRFVEAEASLLRALRIFVNPSASAAMNIKDFDSTEMIGLILNNLGSLYQETGDYVSAEKHFLRSLELSESKLGKEHPKTAITLSNLARLYLVKGDLERAEVMFLRSLEILKKAHNDPENLDVAVMMNNLADVYRFRRDYGRAAETLRKVLEIRERIHRGEHPDVARSLSNLAVLYEEQGDAERAAALMQRALPMLERLLGPAHPDVGSLLNDLGMLNKDRGDFAGAEALLLRALEIRRKALGDNHHEVAITLHNLAALYESKANPAQAIKYMERGNDIREHQLALILAAGSERQKQLYLATLAGETFTSISLHINSAATDPDAVRLALTTILRRKGRALDAMTDQIATLRQRASTADQQLLDQLAAAQSQLAKLRLAGTDANDPSTPEQRSTREQRLTTEIENLQAAISSRSAEFRARTQPVTLEAVQKALPAGAALVELFSYEPFNTRATKLADRFGAPHYVAYVLKDKGVITFVDLGPAKLIDQAADRFLNAISNPTSINVNTTGRALDEMVARPIRKLLGNVRNVIISPDGKLNLVPFAALVDEQGKYLVENYTITYVTSGRDLLRLNASRQVNQSPVVIANPAFDATITTAIPEPVVPNGAGRAPADETRSGTGDARVRRSGNMLQGYWTELRGTAKEAEYLKKLWPDARVLTGKGATETALKQVVAPQILHLATHGFFLQDQTSDPQTGPNDRLKTAGENPLLRSGLVLAGANTLKGGGDEDGVLTALEAAGLNLWGTQLVVLSACQTGVGYVRSGEGVYGLRRALVLAGTESQVMTLWKVDDTATSETIVEYYRRLQAGEGRSEALRQVQLEFLKRKTRQHPFFWASFILNGDWRSMR